MMMIMFHSKGFYFTCKTKF